MKSGWVKSAFTISFLWWVYLFFTTQIVLVFDAEGYEQLGGLLAHQGWAAFLRGGPQREPLFPWLIAVSMHIGEWLKISYSYPFKVIGLSFLWLTMVYAYRLMAMLGVRPVVAAMVLLYMGVSPVMTNSSIRLWSEFAAYPWVVLAVWWTIKSWNFLDPLPAGRREYRKIAGYGAMVALMFLLIMSVKAVAEGIMLFYLWPFYWRVWTAFRSKNFINSKHWMVFILTVFVVFEGVVCTYKALNYHYNGNFAFTNRGDWAWYGNTARRMEPLTPRRLGAAIAFVPGLDVCSSLFPQDECDFWSARHSDDIIGQKQAELTAQGITGKAASEYFIHSSIKMIAANPLQALLLMVVEAHKLFFWEDSIAFVAYPDWLENILYRPGFIKTSKFLLAFLSWAGCAFAFIYLCFHCRKTEEKNKQESSALFWVLHFIFWFMAMYALFFILDRYSYPVIALYMVLIAFALQRILPPPQHPVLRKKGVSATPGVAVVVVVSQLLWFWLAPGAFKNTWAKNPLVAEIVKEHEQAANKAKIMTISYYFPDFTYFADISAGKAKPQKELMDGYRFGKPYIFHTYYQKGADMFPDNDSVNFLLAYCDYYMGDLDDAAMYYQKSLQADPYFFWAYYDLGVVYFQQGQVYKSVLMLTRALALNKEVTLEILKGNSFYRQIWRGMDNPPLVLVNNWSEGSQDAALLLAACYLSAKGYDQSLGIIRASQQKGSWHQDLRQRLNQKALSKQPLDNELYTSLQEKIPVRLF